MAGKYEGWVQTKKSNWIDPDNQKAGTKGGEYTAPDGTVIKQDNNPELFETLNKDIIYNSLLDTQGKEYADSFMSMSESMSRVGDKLTEAGTKVGGMVDKAAEITRAADLSTDLGVTKVDWGQDLARTLEGQSAGEVFRHSDMWKNVMAPTLAAALTAGTMTGEGAFAPGTAQEQMLASQTAEFGAADPTSIINPAANYGSTVNAAGQTVDAAGNVIAAADATTGLDLLNTGIGAVGAYGTYRGLTDQPDAPETPDFTKLAEETSAQAKIDEVTPYGTSGWEQDPVTGRWTRTEEFSPEEQAIFEAEQANRLGATGAAGDLISGYSPIGDFQGYEDKTLEALGARTTADAARREADTDALLASRGIPKYSEAWYREKERIDRMTTDAEQQNLITAQNLAATGYQSDILGAGSRIADFTTFTNTGQPIMPGFQGTTPGADLLTAGGLESQADIGQYNVDVGQQNIQTQAGVDLVTGALITKNKQPNPSYTS